MLDGYRREVTAIRKIYILYNNLGYWSDQDANLGLSGMPVHTRARDFVRNFGVFELELEQFELF